MVTGPGVNSCSVTDYTLYITGIKERRGDERRREETRGEETREEETRGDERKGDERRRDKQCILIL